MRFDYGRRPRSDYYEKLVCHFRKNVFYPLRDVVFEIEDFLQLLKILERKIHPQWKMM